MGAAGGIISMGTGIAGGILGSYYNAAAGRTEQKIDEYNAKVFDIQAEETERAGIAEIANIDRYGVKLASSQRAASARSGVSVNSGSALAIMLDSAAAVEMDKATSGYNTAIGVQRLKSESWMKTYEGKQARIGATFNAGMSMLQSGQGVAARFMGGNSAWQNDGTTKLNTIGYYGNNDGLVGGKGLSSDAGNYLSNRYAFGTGG